MSDCLLPIPSSILTALFDAARLDAAVRAACTAVLCPACELPEGSRLHAAMSSEDNCAPAPGAKWDWEWVTVGRIKMSYATKHHELEWLDDKLAQVVETQRLLACADGEAPAEGQAGQTGQMETAGAVAHLPVLAAASRETLRHCACPTTGCEHGDENGAAAACAEAAAFVRQLHGLVGTACESESVTQLRSELRTCAALMKCLRAVFRWPRTSRS